MKSPSPSRSKYSYQIKKRIMWHLHINGWHLNPRPSWRCPKDGWIEGDEMLKIMKERDYEL